MVVHPQEDGFPALDAAGPAAADDERFAVMWRPVGLGRAGGRGAVGRRRCDPTPTTEERRPAVGQVGFQEGESSGRNVPSDVLPEGSGHRAKAPSSCHSPRPPHVVDPSAVLQRVARQSPRHGRRPRVGRSQKEGGPAPWGRTTLLACYALPMPRVRSRTESWLGSPPRSCWGTFARKRLGAPPTRRQL